MNFYVLSFKLLFISPETKHCVILIIAVFFRKERHSKLASDPNDIKLDPKIQYIYNDHGSQLFPGTKRNTAELTMLYSELYTNRKDCLH